MMTLVSSLSTIEILLLMAATVAVLGKSADWLVHLAVNLSERSGLPKTVVGVTVVSLGTTAPEAATSVLAATQGRSGLALGNAVGSIICDTGLILGLCCLIGVIPLQDGVLRRQGRIQLGSGFLLVLVCIPWMAPRNIFDPGGRLPQGIGIVFLVLLVLYLYRSIVWAGQERNNAGTHGGPEQDAGGVPFTVVKLAGCLALVVASSHALILTATEAARRFDVPDSVVAATLVAFGTSLPELVTAVAAVRRGHGELAIGNIIGADILNVLFVAGAAASVSPGGLEAGPIFFTVLFPGMLAILLVFRVGLWFSRGQFNRSFGFLLLALYVAVTVLSYRPAV